MTLGSDCVAPRVATDSALRRVCKVAATVRGFVFHDMTPLLNVTQNVKLERAASYESDKASDRQRNRHAETKANRFQRLATLANGDSAWLAVATVHCLVSFNK